MSQVEMGYLIRQEDHAFRQALGDKDMQYI